MKKIWWLIVAVFIVVFIFIGEVGGEDGKNKIGKSEIEELVSEQIDLFLVLFGQNQRILEILEKILHVAQKNQKGLISLK